ncbi:MAG TPA: hypothetical protein VIH42_00935 [Thermoguttaceae bacterium]
MDTNTPIWSRLVESPDILWVLLSLAAIIIGAIIIVVIARFLIVHRERMAMIKHGIHPDYPPLDVEVDQHPTKGGPARPV